MSIRLITRLGASLGGLEFESSGSSSRLSTSRPSHSQTYSRSPHSQTSSRSSHLESSSPWPIHSPSVPTTSGHSIWTRVRAPVKWVGKGFGRVGGRAQVGDGVGVTVGGEGKGGVKVERAGEGGVKVAGESGITRKRRRSQEMGQSFGVGRRYTRGRVVAVAPQPAPSPLYLKDIDSLGSFGYASSEIRNTERGRIWGKTRGKRGGERRSFDPKMVFYWILCAVCVGLLGVRAVAWGRGLGIWPVESGFGLGFGFGGWVKGVKWAKWENGWNWEDEVRRVGEMVSIWTGIGRIRWEEWVGWGREFGLEGVWRRYCERTRRGISVPSGWNLDFRAVEILRERLGWAVGEVRRRVGRTLAGVT